MSSRHERFERDRHPESTAEHGRTERVRRTATSRLATTPPAAALQRLAATRRAGAVRRVLVHASVLDGVVAAVKVLTVTLVLEIAITPAIAVGGLVAFAIYASNKLVDDEDEINAPERTRFVAAHRDALTAATAAATVVALALAATAGTLAVTLTILPGVAAVAYSVPLPVVDRRLKDVLGVNNLLVSVSWALPVVALPVVWADGRFTAAAGVVFAFYLAQTVVAFEVRNVRDVAGDRAEGVRTLPVVLGVDRTRTVLYGIDAVAIAVYAAAGATSSLAPPVAAAFALATVFSVVVTAAVAQGDVLADGRASAREERPVRARSATATVSAATNAPITELDALRRVRAVVRGIPDARLAAGRDATYVVVLAIVAITA